jgi:hypothetical protein
MFRSAGARRIFGGRAFYKHLAPLGRIDNNALMHLEIEFSYIKRSCFALKVIR